MPYPVSMALCARQDTEKTSVPYKWNGIKHGMPEGEMLGMALRGSRVVLRKFHAKTWPSVTVFPFLGHFVKFSVGFIYSQVNLLEM